MCVSATVHKTVESGEVVAVCTGMHGTGYRLAIVCVKLKGARRLVKTKVCLYEAH
jgi:hypothetical protein